MFPAGCGKCSLKGTHWNLKDMGNVLFLNLGIS